MTNTATKLMTVEEFDKWVYLPENVNRDFEYIGGKIVEVGSNNYSSAIGAKFVTLLMNFVEKHNLGHVTGADGGYIVVGQRYIPDAAFISLARQPEPSRYTYNPNAPDLAVEVLSPFNDTKDVETKISNYIKAGTLVWLVDPDRREVDIYEPNQPKKTLTEDDILDGGRVLSNFKITIR